MLLIGKSIKFKKKVNTLNKIIFLRELNLAKDFIISVDLGGTKILSALLDKKNNIVTKIKVATNIEQGPDGLVKDIVASVKELMKKEKLKEENIEAISVGVPGTVNPKTGVISVAPNLNIKNYNIKKSIKKLLAIPVLLENDVNLAGLGIKRFEFNDKVKNMLVVFVGTGIGGALFFDGKVYRGSSFYAGEIGHMSVCNNGSLSAENGVEFEKLASRTAVVNGIISQIKKKKKSVLKEHVDKNKKIKSKAIAKAIAEKDKVVIEEVTKACKIIGSVLGSITTLLNLDTVVLGGGLIEANHEFMLPKIKTQFRKTVMKDVGKKTKIVVTKLGDDAPLFGGVALAEEFGGK